MTPQLIATIIDHAISMLGGALGLLVGLRVIGPKPGANPGYEAFYQQWGKHLKWAGPLVMVFALLQIGLAFFGQV